MWVIEKTQDMKVWEYFRKTHHGGKAQEAWQVKTALDTQYKYRIRKAYLNEDLSAVPWLGRTAT
jgi:hypothetical protein